MIAPSAPRELKVTQDMWEDLLCDPVMAAWVIFGVALDAFQAARLRYYWWCQNVTDSSGVGSGKTQVIFLFLCLRCILIPNQVCAIYFPTFSTGQNEFWTYFTRYVLGQRQLFTSQLGNPLKVQPGESIDGDGTVHGPACYTAYFRNGNRLLMPAPSFMKDAVTQASLSVNVMVIEEWPQVDAMSDGINKQLIDRTRADSWNQFHPIWGNHILLSGHAQTRLHPAAKRYNAQEKNANAGDPRFATIAYNYKDYSNLRTPLGKTFKAERRFESTIANKKASSTKTDWLSQYLGIWGMSGEGWFTESALLQAMKVGKSFGRGLVPVSSARQWDELYPVV